MVALAFGDDRAEDSGPVVIGIVSLVEYGKEQVSRERMM